MRRDVLAVILGGGKGTRLRPLTEYRTKPAVPIGGKYRLIDVPVSNCIYSDLGRIYILTQFNSQSLHSHINETYKFDYFHKNFVKIMAAEQSIKTDAWYQGTADAVRKNIIHLKANSKESDLILILSGDQLYKMDFQELIKFHIDNNAQITICSKVVNKKTAAACGILKINKQKKILAFHEKPQKEEIFSDFKLDKNKYLASMGIYIFNRDALFKLLTDSNEDDFGKGIIPHAITQMNVFAYEFEGFWEDIGTIKSFYETNLGVAACEIEFNFNHIFTRPRFLQPTKITNATINRSMISEGSSIQSSNISHSLVGIRSIIGKDCLIEDTVIMGCDGYENDSEKQINKRQGIPNMGFGNNIIVKKAIVDKNARIGNNVRIENVKNIIDHTGENYVIKDGIVIIPKDAIIKDNTVI